MRAHLGSPARLHYPQIEMASRLVPTLRGEGIKIIRSNPVESSEFLRENLWLPATVDYTYRANGFEPGSGSDPASWLDKPYSVLWLALVNKRVVIGGLLIDSRDTCHSTIVRFASPTTEFSLTKLATSFSLLTRLFVTSGTRVSGAVCI